MTETVKEAFAIRRSHPGDVARLIEIWRGAVAATHDFLREADRQEIDNHSCAYLATASLWVLVDETDRPMAFSAVTGSNMDALFVAAEARGRGMGRMLVQHARSLSPTPTLTTQVNEENSQAVGFYLKQGFKPVRRDACDDDGRPYPIVHLAWSGEGGGGPVEGYGRSTFRIAQRRAAGNPLSISAASSSESRASSFSDVSSSKPIDR
jgi:putative acetyltransferase